MHDDYDHRSTGQTMDALLNQCSEFAGEVTNLPVDIEGGSEPFNFPRTWNVRYGNNEARAVSFNWAHQGMGCDGMNADATANPYALTADRLLTESGEIFFLRNHGHYILPASLIES
jgi:hypothetical protein